MSCISQEKIQEAPYILHTLQEISQATNNDPAVCNTLNNAISLKADKSTTHLNTEVDIALALKQNVISGTNLLDVSYLGTGAITNTVFNYLS